MMNLELVGKRALISGSSHGIGLEIAIALAQEGCDVAIMGRDKERVLQAGARIREGRGQDFAGVKEFSLDATNLEELSRLKCEIESKWRGVDILVNNLGGGGRWGDESLVKTENNILFEVWMKNLGVAVSLTKWAIPFMLQGHWGRVVTISSIHGREAGGRPWFAAAKAGQIAFTKALSQDKTLVRNGITFNTVAPGAVLIPDTGWGIMSRDNPKEFQAEVETRPMGRLGSPQEVASVVAFICSTKASWLNGACVVVDGSEGRSF